MCAKPADDHRRHVQIAVIPSDFVSLLGFELRVTGSRPVFIAAGAAIVSNPDFPVIGWPVMAPQPIALGLLDDADGVEEFRAHGHEDQQRRKLPLAEGVQ